MTEPYRRDEEWDCYYEDHELSPMPRESWPQNPGRVHYVERRYHSSDNSDEEIDRVRTRREGRHSPSTVSLLADDQHGKRQDTALPSFIMRERRPAQGPLSTVKECQQSSAINIGRNAEEEPNRRYVGHDQQSHHFSTGSISFSVYSRTSLPLYSVLSGHVLVARPFSSTAPASLKKNDGHSHRTTVIEPGERTRDANAAAQCEFQAVYNSSSARDVTVHLELQLFDDIDQELGEFSRLTRIGHFRDTRSFFDENLRAFLDNPYVFVQ